MKLLKRNLRRKTGRCNYDQIKKAESKHILSLLSPGILQEKIHIDPKFYQPGVLIEEAKTTYFQRIQPAVYIEGGADMFDIVTGDIQTDPIKLAKVEISDEVSELNANPVPQVTFSKKGNRGGTRKGEDQDYIHVHVARQKYHTLDQKKWFCCRNVDYAFMVLVACLLDELVDIRDN